MVHGMNEAYRVWRALKSVPPGYKGLGIKAKKCLYEGVIVPTALYGAGALGMSAERRKVNVLEMKCMRSLVGVSRMDRFRCEKVRRRAGIERELASRADQRVSRWFVATIPHYLPGITMECWGN